MKSETVNGNIETVIVDGKSLIKIHFDLSKTNIPPDAIITNATIDFLRLSNFHRTRLNIENTWRADSSDKAVEGIKPRLHIEY